MTYRYAFAGSAAPRPGRLPPLQSAPGVDKGTRPDLRRAGSPLGHARQGAGARAGSRLVPVYETMDYASEYRNAHPQPRTVYILEQVSETVSSEIIY
ncbi:MAG: hypothetical protein M0C28_21035 [Candidatus Moduliflexus flocculans]|nr:hypothetical protein [Candidatus Moduliflexus flocculans]